MSRDALVVGINTYHHLQPLTAPANDAEAIAQQLSQDNHFLVRRLPEYLDPFEGNIPQIAQNLEVKKSALEEAILQLFLPQAQRIPQTALLYFSGHGLRKERGVTEGFLATSDVNPEADRWGISLKWLREILKQSQIPQQLVWLDCCYAAEFLNYEEANPRGRDRCFIAAAREFEESWQDMSSNYSVMTKVIVQALDPQYQPDGRVDNLRLVALISQTIQEDRQRPVFFNTGEPICLVQSRSSSAPNPTIRLQPEVCPYRGLAAFDSTEEDVRFFYGRTALTDELLETIWQQSFLAVLGASGSGKSSVVQAGLIHAIQQGKKRDTKHWYVLPVIKPGEHPLKNLATAFAPAGSTIRQKERTCQSYIQSFKEQGAGALADLVADYAPAPVVLVIDQFEEIFTLCQDDQERQQFLVCLIGGLNSMASDASNSSLRVVITMRADFFGKCLEQDYSGLAEQIKTNTISITPLNRGELRDAIVQPAAKVGLQLEPALVQQMITDVQDSPGSLPLLQYALTELWEQWHQGWQQSGTAVGNTLRFNNYDQIGGVSGALEKQANKVYDSLSALEQNVARRIFLDLTHLGEGTEDTRRRICKQELINDQHPEILLDQVISKLSDARLIVTDERPHETLSDVVLDVAHEALIRHWAQLRQWVNADRDSLRTERKLKAAAQEWQEKGQQVSYLWLGARLAEAEEIYQQSLQLGRLDYLTQEFVQASQTEQARQEREKDKQIRMLNRALTESRLQEQASRTLYLTLANPKLGLELVLKTMAENLENQPNRLLAAVQSSLQQAMVSARISNTLRGHVDEVRCIAFSPDSKTIASGGSDQTIRLWDLRGIPLDQPFQGHKGTVVSVAFSPNGKIVASGSNDQTVRLWNLESNPIGDPIGDPFKGHQAEIKAVAFSPDGKTIASGGSDQTIRLWDLQGNPINELFHEQSDVTSIVFSPNGQIVASGSGDQTLRLWDLQGNPIGQPFQGHRDAITSVAFSPDGKFIISGSYDKTLRMWDLQGNPIGQLFQGHRDAITSVAFSSDGRTIVSGSIDRTIRLWDLQGNPIGQPFQEHEDIVTCVAFSPDGQTIASGSWDRTVRLWDFQNDSIGLPFRGHKGAIRSVAFSPDVKTIVTGSIDRTVCLWNLQGKLVKQPFQGHRDAVRSVAFSPDGNVIVSGSKDRTVRLWNLQGDPIGQPFQGHQDAVVSVAFSPNSQTVASGSWDKTVRLWNWQGDPVSKPFRGHQNSITSVAFSPNGQTIVSGSWDKTVRLWNLQGDPVSKPFRGHEDSVTSVAFSPNGKFIVSASYDKTVRLWDLQGNLMEPPFQGHWDMIMSVAFSPDGKTIISGGNDKTIRLWDLQGNPIGQPFQGHKSEVLAIAFSPDGKIIASGSSDQTVKLWRGSWQAWLKICCERLAYHLISKNSEIDIAQSTCAVYIQYASTSQDLAHILKRQGNDLARQGKTALALSKFQQAAEVAPTLNLDPEAEVHKWSSTS